MKKTLRNIIDEQLKPDEAGTLAQIVKKYADRAVQDKSADAQWFNRLQQELLLIKNQQPVQQQQNVQTQQNQQ